MPGIADIMIFPIKRREHFLTRRKTKSRTAISGHSELSVTQGGEAGWPLCRNSEVVQLGGGLQTASDVPAPRGFLSVSSPLSPPVSSTALRSLQSTFTSIISCAPHLKEETLRLREVKGQPFRIAPPQHRPPPQLSRMGPPNLTK